MTGGMQGCKRNEVQEERGGARRRWRESQGAHALCGVHAPGAPERVRGAAAPASAAPRAERSQGLSALCTDARAAVSAPTDCGMPSHAVLRVAHSPGTSRGGGWGRRAPGLALAAMLSLCSLAEGDRIAGAFIAPAWPAAGSRGGSMRRAEGACMHQTPVALGALLPRLRGSQARLGSGHTALSEAIRSQEALV